MERVLVEIQTEELWQARLVELSKGEYTLTTIMFTKKSIFGNWTKVKCVETIDISTRKHNLTIMLCH
jgi:hypothetical protein